MAKPIFLIQVPRDIIPPDKILEISNKMQTKLFDWHVLIISTSVSDFQFTAFSEQAATDVEIENLTEMLLNQFK